MAHIGAQHIGIQLEGEDGSIRESCEVNFANFMTYFWNLPDGQREKYEWVSTIDEYGRTVFNHYQVPKLVREMEGLLKILEDEVLNSEIKLVMDFVLKVDSSPHLYICFIGD